jgi:hypothetical protein
VSVQTIWVTIGVVLLCLLLAVVLRVVWVWVAWRRLRRHLRRGSPTQRVSGAWVWSGTRLRTAGWPLPASLSVDRAAESGGPSGLPRNARPPLRRIATATVGAVFSPDAAPADADDAWRSADEVGRVAVRSLPLARRLGFAVRQISSTPSRPAASAPGQPEEQRL